MNLHAGLIRKDSFCVEEELELDQDMFHSECDI